MRRLFVLKPRPDTRRVRRYCPYLLVVLATSGGVSSAVADTWGGSLDVTSDYLVRGISRSDGQAAVQGEYHYLSTSGFVAGAFASTARLDRVNGTEAELSPFLGFAWSDDQWHGKILASHYAYTRRYRGSRYSYDELDVDVGYQDWLDLAAVYSPNFPRYIAYRGRPGNASTSAEANVRQLVHPNLYLVGGVGYDYESGAGAAGYVYWSVGASYDAGPVILALSFVDTSAAAKSLFYDEAASRRWVGTVIWRF